MKKINKKDMKVGDVIYIEHKTKPKTRRFIVKINRLRLENKDKEEVDEIVYWALQNILTKGVINFSFEPTDRQGVCVMWKSDWEDYDLFRLNKKEIEKFKKLLILKHLE